MEEQIHVVYAADDCFAEILGVSLMSLYENNRDMENIIVYILDNHISEENKDKIRSVSSVYGRLEPYWLKSKDISDELKINVALDRGSLSQYARLFVSSLLPDNLCRVLYLDCDIIVNKSLRELWNLDLCGKTIAALDDAFSPLYRRNIGLEPQDVMFNSGVMLIDLVCKTDGNMHIPKRETKKNGGSYHEKEHHQDRGKSPAGDCQAPDGSGRQPRRPRRAWMRQ